MGELVLVTGASGFIAAHIIKHLLNEGYRIRGTIRNLADDQKVKPLRALASESNAANLELVQADLLDVECWPSVVDGCKYVLHTASPFPVANPKNDDDVIKPAVDGTLNVLKACGPSVKRVVVTSSVAAIYSGVKSPSNGSAFTEEDWANPENATTVYEKSKALAERAAWDYVNGLDEGQRFEMTVINPALVVGPVISGGTSTSVDIFIKILSKSHSMLPRLNFSIVDVREVAAAHVIAMKSPDTVGKRHIMSEPNLFFRDMALIIEKEFKPMGYDIPTGNAPYFVLWFIARCDAGLRAILPTIGKVKKFDNTRMKEVLKITPRPVEETIIDCCYSLVDLGLVPKTDQYKPRE